MICLKRKAALNDQHRRTGVGKVSLYLVELHPDCWIAKTDGDPGRTIVEANAQRFKTAAAARGALTRARKYRPFLAARIVEVDR